MTDQIIALPLYEPMYINGQLSPTWVNFFESLVTLSNSADMIKLVELAQNVGEQVSNQAVQAQQGFEISTIQNTFDLVQYSSMQHTEKFETIPILPNQTQELPPLQAVFLCHEQPFSMVGLPPSGVISP